MNLRKANDMNAVIKMRGLSKVYSGKQVLEPIDLDIHAGEVVGYLGPNGAGKSTTVKILIGVTKEFNGSAQDAGLEAGPHRIEIRAPGSPEEISWQAIQRNVRGSSCVVGFVVVKSRRIEIEISGACGIAFWVQELNLRESRRK